MKLTSDNISTIAKALVAAQREMGNAVKDSKNPFFKSKYADLNAIREAVLPVFNSHGISVLQPTVFVEGKKFVQTIAIHESGEFISGLTEILSAKELDAQAQGSGISYARRYGLQSLANVGAEDDDGQAAVGKPIQKESSSTNETSAAKSGNKEDSISAYNAKTGNFGGPDEPKQELSGKRSFRKPKTISEEL